MKKTLLILTAIFISIIGYSQTFTDNFIGYNVTSATTVEVTDYDYTNGGSTVIIPASVNFNSTNYSVTSIKFLAFQNNAITSVDLPNSLISIGVGAFSGSTLDTVTFGNSVTTIGGSAFYNCSLTDVTIPDSVISIDNYAFQNNSLANLTFGNSLATIGNWAFTSNQLAVITLPNSVTTIGDFAFQNNPLTSIISEATIPPTITTSSTSGMDTFNSNRTAIDLFIPSGTMGAYVTDSGALWTGFGSVTEEGSLAVGDTFIENYITYEVTSLTPDTVEAIDYDIAGGTVVDIPVTVPNTSFSVISIGGQAFSGKGLTAVTIPFGVETISFSAFSNNQLTTVIIPDSVINMYNAVFWSNQLTSVTISNNLTTIGSTVFSNNQLTSITIPDGVTTIFGSAFSFNNLTNVTLPNSVINIYEDVFRNNNLTTITIPSNVVTIGNNAFRDNPLASVTSLAMSPPNITTSNTGFADTFANDRSNIALHIPPGTMGAYVTDSGALWTGFNPVTEDALSVSDFELENDIKVITTVDAIKVLSSNGHRLENYTIYTISGAKIATGIESEIATSSFASGIYVLKLDFDKGTVIKKTAIN